MRTLFFDTATSIMVVALLDGKKVEITTKAGQKDHGAYLVEQINGLLTNNDIKIKQIDTIVVGIGPGSYTGLRVAIMTAKMLGYTLNIPVRTISSIAFLTSGYKDKVFGFIDAKNEAGFCGMYHQAKMISADSYKLKDELTSSQKECYINLNQETILLDLNNILENSVLVDDIHSLIPNYLKRTKAEEDYDKSR